MSFIYVIDIHFELNLPLLFYLFNACSLLSSYSFHAHSSADARGRKEIWQQQYKAFFSWIALLLAIAFISMFVYDALYFRIYFPLGVLTLLYTLPKIESFNKLSFLVIQKSVFISIVWTYTLSIAPFYFVGKKPFYDLILLTFVLILSVCWSFDFRDRKIDTEKRMNFLISLDTKRYLLLQISITILAGIIAVFNFKQISFNQLILYALATNIFLCFYKSHQKSSFHHDFFVDGIISLPYILYFSLQNL